MTGINSQEVMTLLVFVGQCQCVCKICTISINQTEIVSLFVLGRFLIVCRGFVMI